MNYYDEKQFKVKAKTSRSTLYRFYKKNEELKAETKLEGKRLYPESHLRYFSSEIMFDENKMLRLENQSMKNLIDCLADKESLSFTFWQLKWDFALTIAYKLELNKKSCYNRMIALYNQIIEKYGDETDFRIYFTTEPFKDRKSFHNHFTIHISNKKLHPVIIEEIKNFFSYDRIDLKLYDSYNTFIFYMAKNGLVGEDWDILGNNLGNQKLNDAN